MKHRNKRIIDWLGLTLIRIIVASYFLAVSVDLVQGTHPSLLFGHMSNPDAANILGSFLLFMGSYLLLCGLAVRLVSIYLVLLVLGSSIMQNFVLPTDIQIDNFWRDLVLVSALILGYGTLTRRELQKAAFVQKKYNIRKAMANSGLRTNRPPRPLLREISVDAPAKSESAPVAPQPATPMVPRPPAKARRALGLLPEDDDFDEENIFAT